MVYDALWGQEDSGDDAAPELKNAVTAQQKKDTIAPAKGALDD
jgi:hypothetical protein